MNSDNVKKELLLTDGRRIAYHLNEGASPTVVFMGGFKSDMTGSKATALEAFCRARSQRFIRFDYTGHGQSSGAFIEGSISQWTQDALDMLDALAGKELILVGSSMGAWISLLCSLARPEYVKALIGVAAAPDFTERLIWNALDDAQKSDLIDKGVFYAPSCYGEEPYPITKKLIDDGRNNLLLDAAIAINVPVRLIHGDCDQDVPWQHATLLMQQLTTQNVQLRLVKGGDHRLSSEQHLQILCQTLEELLQP